MNIRETQPTEFTVFRRCNYSTILSYGQGGSNEATGRSRGGSTTKVHAVTDGLGNPLRFLLSSGNRNDICLAREILEPFELTRKMILADRGYDSDLFVRWIKERGGIPVIPSRNSARHPRKTDWHTYKERRGYPIICVNLPRGVE